MRGRRGTHLPERRELPLRRWKPRGGGVRLHQRPRHVGGRQRGRPGADLWGRHLRGGLGYRQRRGARDWLGPRLHHQRRPRARRRHHLALGRRDAGLRHQGLRLPVQSGRPAGDEVVGVGVRTGRRARPGERAAARDRALRRPEPHQGLGQRDVRDSRARLGRPGPVLRRHRRGPGHLRHGLRRLRRHRERGRHRHREPGRGRRRDLQRGQEPGLRRLRLRGEAMARPRIRAGARRALDAARADPRLGVPAHSDSFTSTSSGRTGTSPRATASRRRSQRASSSSQATGRSRLGRATAQR